MIQGNNKLTIVITVDCEEGEECTKLSEITSEEMNKLNSLLLEIRNNQGYYPTGNYLVYPDPSPEELYRNRFSTGFDILESRLPMPNSGFRRILEINVFQEPPISLYM